MCSVAELALHRGWLGVGWGLAVAAPVWACWVEFDVPLATTAVAYHIREFARVVVVFAAPLALGFVARAWAFAAVVFATVVLVVVMVALAVGVRVLGLDPFLDLVGLPCGALPVLPLLCCQEVLGGGLPGCVSGDSERRRHVLERRFLESV